MRKMIALSCLLLLGAGCGEPTGVMEAVTNVGSMIQERMERDEAVPKETSVVFPVDEYIARRNLKAFGEYIQDRFTGYHVADDIEFTDIMEAVPVRAIADGEVLEKKEFISGYGGVARILHHVNGEQVTAIYGHLDFDGVELQEGDQVTKGQVIARLGEKGPKTDGERKHLHFGLYKGDERRINGYEASASSVDTWINPTSFFLEQGLDAKGLARLYEDENEPGTTYENLSFLIPEGMEVEYIPSIQSLNIFSVDGEGTARERSQIFIRFFDASSFLTLNTVTIHSMEDLEIGEENYTARRYDIEKNAGVADFPEQPSWRNERHIVTDTRKSDGFTRYFVTAKNPELDMAVYEAFLKNVVLK